MDGRSERPMDGLMDEPMDGLMDGPTGRSFYRDAFLTNAAYKKEKNKAGYTANTSRDRVARGGNACFLTF